jgi:hypothetical protein
MVSPNSLVEFGISFHRLKAMAPSSGAKRCLVLEEGRGARFKPNTYTFRDRETFNAIRRLGTMPYQYYEARIHRH